jgi:hypothetical protein
MRAADRARNRLLHKVLCHPAAKLLRLSGFDDDAVPVNAPIILMGTADDPIALKPER